MKLQGITTVCIQRKFAEKRDRDNIISLSKKPTFSGDFFDRLRLCIHNEYTVFLFLSLKKGFQV